MQETGHMGETEREIDVEIQGESYLILDLSLCAPPLLTFSLSLLHTHTVWATYVLLHPYLLAGAGASAPATLPRARAAYVGKVGTTEGGGEMD